MRKIFVGFLFFANGLVLSLAIYLLCAAYYRTRPLNPSIVNYGSSVFAATPKVLGIKTGPSIITGDARVKLTDNFFHKYRSPMAGQGGVIVSMADKFAIPYNLVPAIAQCESNLGKVMPPGSYNAWGYGIYGQKVLRFASWGEAIERVSGGLRKNYFDRGLDEPEKIMKKYTPSSNGSWANCVTKFMGEIE